ncbi:GTP cyclohydrolase II [Mortierella claussenii]|nr:GTP cyclohydrolase II [Mortierella claussenii]
MTEAPVAPAQSNYIPRNAIDHMSPFFFKNHSHAHSHSHARQHHHDHAPARYAVHHQQQHISKQSPTAATATRAVSVAVEGNTSAATTFLQTPVPRRPSIQIDSNSTSKSSTAVLSSSISTAVSYNTPPATPPLGQEEDTGVAWCTARARIPTPDGSEYFLHIYENSKDKKEHLAFVFGDAIRSKSLDKVQWNETEMDRVKRGAYTGRLRSTVSEEQQNASLTTGFTTTASMESVSSVASGSAPAAPLIPLARIHSECFTGEIGHSARCDCGEQLDEAIRLMKAEGSGVVVYLRQEGRGIGLAEKLRAYNLQDLGYDTVMANLMLNHGADERTYEVAQAILQDLGLSQIRLLTNNPDKIEQIEKDSHIKVVERVPMMPKSWEAIEQGIEMDFEVKEGAVENKIVKGKELDKYLKVKVERMRHLISIPSSMSI